MQLSDKQIQEIVAGTTDNVNRINYRWLTGVSGCFDVEHDFLGNKFHMREFIHQGKIKYTAMKAWVEDPVHNSRLPQFMQAPWGTYPNLPPKE